MSNNFGRPWSWTVRPIPVLIWRTRKTQEALMVGVRSDRARARARNLLETVYPVPSDAEVYRLRQLAMEYVQEAERLEREQKGGATESDELISAALDNLARNYFARAVGRSRSLAQSRRKRTDQLPALAGWNTDSADHPDHASAPLMDSCASGDVTSPRKHP
jgi:hypothetical protein